MAYQPKWTSENQRYTWRTAAVLLIHYLEIISFSNLNFFEIRRQFSSYHIKFEGSKPKINDEWFPSWLLKITLFNQSSTFKI